MLGSNVPRSCPLARRRRGPGRGASPRLGRLGTADPRDGGFRRRVSGHATLEPNVATLPIKLTGMKIGASPPASSGSRRRLQHPYGSEKYGSRYQGQRGSSDAVEVVPELPRHRHPRCSCLQRRLAARQLSKQPAGQVGWCVTRPGGFMSGAGCGACTAGPTASNKRAISRTGTRPQLLHIRAGQSSPGGGVWDLGAGEALERLRRGALLPALPLVPRALLLQVKGRLRRPRRAGRRTTAHTTSIPGQQLDHQRCDVGQL